MTIKSLLLIHGAGSGPWVFDGWPEAFPEIEVGTVDLQEGLDVGTTTMADYAENALRAAKKLTRPVALCGWSMGGLVAMMAAQEVGAAALILLEASAPAEVQGLKDDVPRREGVFDPEDEYGKFPAGVAARPESVWARAERKSGISVPSLRMPTLVIYGKEFPTERGSRLAATYGAREAQFEQLNHWGLVRSRDVRKAIREFLQEPNLLSPTTPS